ncbi:MAG: alpha/beta hydrolase [Clostridia bacterium]|nr:alpha/beta hydrolase [Clostridia bacterium]
MLVKRDCYFDAVGANRPLHIWLPDDYHSSDEQYPVMYFFDGHNLYRNEDATYGKSWGLADYLTGWDKKIICVGMECGHGEGERLSEYMPFRPYRGAFSQYEAKGDLTMQWIVNTVKPLIDQTYRTIPFRECTGIAGSSMGGLMSVYAVSHYNRWFSKGGCLSSAIGFCAPQIFNDMNQDTIDPDTRIFLSWGTLETKGIENPWIEDRESYTYRRNKAVANKIENHGGIARLYCQVGGQHCEADWEKQLPLFLPFLWQNR